MNDPSSSDKNEVPVIGTLSALLKNLRVPATGWDVMLVGDGSGSKWNNPGGWACAMIIRKRDTGRIHYLKPFSGAVSRGPINWLEALPYWHCIRHHYYAMNGKKLAEEGGVDVHVVSDSQWVVNTMSGRYVAKAHGDMVTLFHYFQTKGYRIWWHHRTRETVKLNSITDRLAVNAREYINLMECPTISIEFPPAE